MSIAHLEATLPGVLYTCPSPGAAAFKQPGDRVELGDTIALVEVMKSFRAVEAEAAGTFLRYVIPNETAVDAGETICEIDV